MSTTSERRSSGTNRIPFDALVELGGAIGPTFEAQAVNLSEVGMQLRTAYLPDVGQELSCRFELGRDRAVVARGVVVWSEEAGKGGEFGLRFVALDSASASTLRAILAGDDGSGDVAGAKVRLHIDGLASPLRARVQTARDRTMVTSSDLGFLRLGKSVEVEDPSTGEHRAARIDGVDVALAEGSEVPELVVKLAFERAIEEAHDDAPAHVAGAPVEAGFDAGGLDEAGDLGADASIPVREGTPAPAPVAALAMDELPVAAPRPARVMRTTIPPVVDDGEGDGEPEGAPLAGFGAADHDDAEALKSPVARAASKVTPAVTELADRARLAVAAWVAKRKEAAAPAGDAEGAPRRRTTPSPSGGLHAAGRKVVREESASGSDAAAPRASAREVVLGIMAEHKKKVFLGGTLASALVLGALATKKPEPSPNQLAVDPTVAAAVAATEASLAASALPQAAPSPVTGAAAAPARAGRGAALAMDDGPMDDADEPPSATKTTPRAGKPAPFGTVGTRGKVLTLKMDGPIDRILGASQAVGFVVTVPGRKSLEPASPLAQKDKRIGGMRVANEPEGAELTVAFKDGVPPYLVRAKGETLEIVLGGTDEPELRAEAKSEPRGTAASESTRHERTAKRGRKHRRR